MKYLIALLLISSSALAAPSINNLLKSSPQEDQSLTAFLKVQLLNFRNLFEVPIISIPVDDPHLSKNDSTLSYTLDATNIEFHHLPQYSISKVNADLTAGLIHFELDIEDFVITGNYTLDGSVSSVITLKGEGSLNIRMHTVTLIAIGEIAVDAGIGSIENLRFVSIAGGVNATFRGIVGEEIIGDLIKEHLEQIGTELFESALDGLNTVLQTMYTDYLNEAFQENPMELIFRTKVLDTASDALVDNGWSVDIEDCLYSEYKIDFTCTGQSVVLNEENGSSGFWASCTPVVAEMCTFFFKPAAGERIHQIKLDAYYIDNPPSFGMIEYEYVNSSGIRVDQFNENGIVEFDPTKTVQYARVYPNYAIGDDNEALYTIIDRLSAIMHKA